MTEPDLLEEVVKAASRYGRSAYETRVVVTDRSDDTLTVRTVDGDDEAGPAFQLSWFGELYGVKLVRLVDKDGEFTVVAARGDSLFALLYA